MTMSSTFNPKRALYAQFAVVAKAIAHEHRLELLELVATGRNAETEALGERFWGFSIANVSQHLQNLRRAGIGGASRRQAKFVLYRLADEAILTIAGCPAESGGAQRSARLKRILAQLLP
jgi:ArsR family transcriptional regulator